MTVCPAAISEGPDLDNVIPGVDCKVVVTVELLGIVPASAGVTVPVLEIVPVAEELTVP
ncbi:hypothetical protein D3C85_1236410 [compost metagenome]